MFLTFFLDPKVVDDNKTKNIADVTLSFTFFHQIIYKKDKFIIMSSGEKKHGFHLVDPSPWPIYVSFATLVLAFGAVYYFHTKALWLLLVGFALVIYGALCGGEM